MALIIILLRTIGSLVFGAVVFVSFLGFLLANEVQVHLLDDSFYTRPLAENDIYNRIYDELLIDPELAEQSQRLLGDFDIPTRDAIALSRKVITPRYLQTQVEANISSVMTYLKKESYDPKAYIELELPITNIKAVIFEYLDARITGMEIIPVSTPGELVRELELFFLTVDAGKIPSQVPSLNTIPLVLRTQAYDEALQELGESGAFGQRSIQRLENQRNEITGHLAKGDVKSALKLAAPILAEPFVDQAINEIRLGLDSRDRLDLVATMASANNQSKVEFLEDWDTVRDLIDKGITIGRIGSLTVMATAVVLLALVHLPRFKQSVLWPSLSLLITGIVFLMMGLSLKTQLSNRLTPICGDLPASACNMVLDVSNSMAIALGDGVMGSSIVITIIGGGILFALVVVVLVRRYLRPNVSVTYPMHPIL